MTGITTFLLTNPAPRRRLTVEEFQRLGEDGSLAEDDRVELIDGELIRMAPIGPRHAIVVDALAKALIDATRGKSDVLVRTQNPLALGTLSQPQPDVALVLAPWPGYGVVHPDAKSALLVVEVSDATIRYDLREKMKLYADALIPEYWAVDLNQNVVHRMLYPASANGYQKTTPIRTGSIELSFSQSISVAVSDFLP